MKRVAVYCRVSTNEEGQQLSLENQKRFYKYMVESNKDYLLVGVYIETATGLNTYKRPEFNKMLKKCKKGEIDLIITKSISRFSRNTVDFIDIIRKLKELNVDVYFESENIYLLKERTELTMTILECIAQEESIRKSENTKWGLTGRFMDGSSGLANRICYGYKKSKDGLLEIDPETSKNVKLIFDLYLKGYSLTKISKELFNRNILTPTGKEKWTSVAIDKILSNEKYAGDVLLQKTYTPNIFDRKQVKNKGNIGSYLYENNHIGIIDRETFNAVQIEKENRTNLTLNNRGKEARKTTRFSSGNTLAGKIKCAECGRNFRRITTHSGEIVWRCAGRVEGKTKCQAISVKQYVIDDLITKKLGLISKDKSYEMIDSVIVDGEIININHH